MQQNVSAHGCAYREGSKETRALGASPLQRYPFELHNAYGPTENTVATSCYTVPIGSVRPPIGTPAGGCRLYVLDHDMQVWIVLAKRMMDYLIRG
jgi:non-ribosomal peptide synthetase component F